MMTRFQTFEVTTFYQRAARLPDRENKIFSYMPDLFEHLEKKSAEEKQKCGVAGKPMPK
jgi:hypothetical protein